MTAPTETPAAPAAPKIRYFTVLPSVVRLKARDLVPQLPAGAWTGPEDREITLSAAEVLEKNTPRIRFARLVELLPDHVRPTPGAPEWISLPAAAIALAYLPLTAREPLDEPPPGPAHPPEASDGKPAPLPMPGWKRLLKPKLAPPPGEKPAATPATRHLAIAESILALPGVTGCEIRRGSDSARAGSLPLDTAELGLSALLAKTAGTAITIHTATGAISFLQRGASSLTVAHESSDLPPKLREKIVAVLEATGAKD